MNNKIKSLAEIDFKTPSIILFDATVIDILTEGDGEKKPMKFTLKLEESGEQIVVASWKFDLLNTLKTLVNTDDVFEFKGQAGSYGQYGDQIRIGDARDIQMKSSRKVIKSIDSLNLRKKISEIINTYLPVGSKYRILVDTLIMENDKFWLWPAATKVHHNYQGGLAKHSLNVCRNAINIWKTYEGVNIDIKAVVAGALLHDIGKLQEYKEDGSRTKYGDLIPHPVAGYEKIVRLSLENGWDPEKDIEIVMLGHILLTHHEKLEFGASTLPNILEAVIVAKSDALDAAYESADRALDNLILNETSERLLAIDGAKMFKWH